MAGDKYNSSDLNHNGNQHIRTSARVDNSGSAVGVQRPLNKFEGESIEDPYGGSRLSDRGVIPG